MIEIKGLSKQYRRNDSPVLRGIDYTFPDRGLFVLVGASGSGKSTFLRAVAGLIPYEGTVLLDGRKPTLVRDSDIGFVFQDFRLEKEESVLQAVAEGMLTEKISKEHAERLALNALRQCGVEDLAEKNCSALSFGQRQRVALSRAICKHPKYLLADEPTGNLDEENAKAIMKLLSLIAKSALVILVTHQGDIAFPYASRILSLKDGTLEEEQQNEAQESADDQGKDTLDTDKPSSVNKSKTDQSSSPFRWLFYKRFVLRKHKALFMLVLFAISLFSLLGMETFIQAYQNYRPIKAGEYNKDTLALTSDQMMGLEREELLEMYDDPEAGLLDPAPLVFSEETGIRISFQNFSFARYGKPVDEDEETFPIYALSYKEALSAPFKDEVSDPEDGVIIDESILRHLESNVLQKDKILGSKFSLYDQKLDSTYKEKAYTIRGISHIGYPFIILKDIDSLGYNYHYRGGFSHRLDELMKIQLVDGNKLPKGYTLSAEKREDTGKPLFYLNKKAKSLLSGYDVPYLGFSASDGVLSGTREDRPIVALYDIPEKKETADTGEEVKIEGIDSKNRFFRLFLKAERNMNDILSFSSTMTLTAGRAPKKEGEYVVSSSWLDLLGSLAKASEAVKDLNIEIVGAIDAPWTAVYGAGKREYLSSFLQNDFYLTRYITVRGVILGAPRLFSYDEAKTRAYIQKKFSGHYRLQHLSETIEKYNRENAFAQARIPFILFLIAFIAETVFVFAVTLSHALSLRSSYALERCLGFTDKDRLWSSVLSEMLYLALPIFSAILLLFLYQLIFHALLPWLALVFGLFFVLLGAIIDLLGGAFTLKNSL